MVVKFISDDVVLFLVFGGQLKRPENVVGLVAHTVDEGVDLRFFISGGQARRDSEVLKTAEPLRPLVRCREVERLWRCHAQASHLGSALLLCVSYRCHHVALGTATCVGTGGTERDNTCLESCDSRHIHI